MTVPANERDPDIHELDPKDRLTSVRVVGQGDNEYLLNRDNPEWPLAVKPRPKTSTFVSSKQRRAVNYG